MKRLMLALALPLLFLTALWAQAHYQRSHGTTVFFDIRGYDPRDLLSGHYLRYQVDYHIANELSCNPGEACCLCLQTSQSKVIHSQAYLCDNQPSTADCPLFIQGQIDKDLHFVTGIERYFIPEDKRVILNHQLLTQPASLQVSITNDGKAAIQNLLIEGQPISLE